MSKILDDTATLKKLSRDELDELLGQDKYNKANLREQVRRLVNETNMYEKAWEDEKRLNKERQKEMYAESLVAILKSAVRDSEIDANELLEMVADKI
ncbi:hypothetical protein bcgnr5378_37630 [Bacillus cereus]|uniref:Uncharacterized protein n=1 Tax=Bacillus cereus TaxID=1396 RepID=A0A164QMI6_BACCE|nr:hypothetical protein [Bacillus cereus]KZD71907.1 hypothetical protein B4088_0368 [Bacillus cereus]